VVLACTVSEILQVLCLETDTVPIYITRILGVFPFVNIAYVGYVGVNPSWNLKLISREIIFEVFQLE